MFNTCFMLVYFIVASCSGWFKAKILGCNVSGPVAALMLNASFLALSAAATQGLRVGLGPQRALGP